MALVDRKVNNVQKPHSTEKKVKTRIGKVCQNWIQNAMDTHWLFPVNSFFSSFFLSQNIEQDLTFWFRIFFKNRISGLQPEQLEACKCEEVRPGGVGGGGGGGAKDR